MEDKLAQLWEFYCKTNDMKLLFENLYKESCEVADKFTTKHYPSFTEKDKIEFINLVNTTKKNQTTFPLTTCIIAALINVHAPDQYLHQLLKDIILKAKSSGKIPNYKCEGLNNYLLDKTKGNMLAMDYSSWSRKELEKFQGFLLETYRQVGKDFKYKDQLEQWLEKYNFAPLGFIEDKVVPAKKLPATKKSSAASPVVAINEFKELFEQMFDNKINGLMAEITLAKNEIQKFNQSIFEKNEILAIYTAKLQSKEQEIISLKEMLVEKEPAGKLTVSKNDEHYKAEIEDLKARLKASFQADDITKKQELITLKKNIGEAVKLQYVDFCENKDVVCNEDNYEALKNNLEYVFRGLKRYGIEL